MVSPAAIRPSVSRSTGASARLSRVMVAVVSVGVVVEAGAEATSVPSGPVA